MKLYQTKLYQTKISVIIYVLILLSTHKKSSQGLISLVLDNYLHSNNKWFNYS